MLNPIHDARLNNWNGYQILRHMILFDSKERSGGTPSRTNLRVDELIEFRLARGGDVLNSDDNDLQSKGHLEFKEDAGNEKENGVVVLELINLKEERPGPS